MSYYKKKKKKAASGEYYQVTEQLSHSQWVGVEGRYGGQMSELTKHPAASWPHLAAAF